LRVRRKFVVAVVFSLGVAAAVFCFFFSKKEDTLRGRRLFSIVL